MLARHAFEIKEKPAKKSDDWISVSELVYLCPREEILCAEEGHVRTDIIDPVMRQIFDFGNAYQDIFRDLIAPSGSLIGMWMCKECRYVHGSTDGKFTVNSRGAKESELKKLIPIPTTCSKCGAKDFEYIEDTILDRSLKVSGHPDGYLSNRRMDSVLEIKTTNDRRYKKAKESPFIEHLEQVMFYAWKTTTKNITLMYFNKNGGSYHTYEMPLDMEIVDRMIRRLSIFRETMKKLETKEAYKLPGRICETPKDQRAKSCEMCQKCFERED
jgi:hypothetical protein